MKISSVAAHVSAVVKDAPSIASNVCRLTADCLPVCGNLTRAGSVLNILSERRSVRSQVLIIFVQIHTITVNIPAISANVPTIMSNVLPVLR
jgi:hypothetical protein